MLKRFEIFGLLFQLENASELAYDGRINTIIVSPHHSSEKDLPKYAQFILRIRKKRPEIVFILNVDNQFHEELCTINERFKHYFRIDRDSMSIPLLNNLLLQCQEWHYGLHQYDVAISFAGKDRKTASSLARNLRKLGSRVFFDEFEKAALLGEDLHSYLYRVYSEEARHCCLLISKAYADGIWTMHERQAALSRALKTRDSDYIIPITIDKTQLPELMDKAHISIDKGVSNIAHVIHDKLWLTPSSERNRPRFFDRPTIG